MRAPGWARGPARFRAARLALPPRGGRAAGAAVLAALAAALAAAPAGALSRASPVAPGTAPWLARTAGCSGALIAPDRVVTAAHCVQGTTGALRVLVGDGTPQTARAVAARGTSVHPGFRNVAVSREPFAGQAARFDAALVLLAAPLEIAPLPVATSPSVPGMPAAAYGFGVTRAVDEHPASAARTAPFTLLADADCGRAYRPGLFEPRSTLCAADLSKVPPSNPCGGDSGGPLVAEGRLVGLISWGVEVRGGSCEGGTTPSAFADAAALSAFLLAPDPILRPSTPLLRAGLVRRGRVLRCRPGRFGGDPATVRYGWEGRSPRRTSGAVRIPGRRSVLQVGRGRRGWTIGCVVRAVNAGGEAVLRSPRVRVP